MNWPEILTIKWWRWCLKYGWNGLAKERLRIHYVRHIRRQLKRPICWVRGHVEYKWESWGGGHIECSRCKKYLRTLWRPIPIHNHTETKT